MLRRVLWHYNIHSRPVAPVIRALLARPAIPMFLPVAFASSNFVLAILIIFYAWLLARLAAGAASANVESTGLFSLAAAVNQQTNAALYTLEDYFPNELPAFLWDHPSFAGRPAYLIVFIPGLGMPFSVPTKNSISVIAVGWPPGKMNPYRYFVLLHEMGHAGRRNRSAGAGRLHVWFNALAAAATIIVFAQTVVSFLILPLTLLAAWASLFSQADGSLEAEIRADHFAIFAARELRDTRYFAPAGAAPRSDPGPLQAPNFVPGRDDDAMLTRLRHLRPALFEEMRRDALNSALRPPTFYIERARLDHHMQVETLVGSGLLVFLMLCAWFTVANLHWAVVKASLGFGVLASWGMLTSQQKAHQWERILGALCDRDAEAATTAIERLNLWTDSHAPISVRIDRWILSRIYR